MQAAMPSQCHPTPLLLDTQTAIPSHRQACETHHHHSCNEMPAANCVVARHALPTFLGTHIHPHTHTDTHTQACDTHTCTCTHTHTGTHTNIHTHTHMNTHAHTHTNTHAHTHTNAHAHTRHILTIHSKRNCKELKRTIDRERIDALPTFYRKRENSCATYVLGHTHTSTHTRAF